MDRTSLYVWRLKFTVHPETEVHNGQNFIICLETEVHNMSIKFTTCAETEVHNMSIKFTTCVETEVHSKSGDRISLICGVSFVWNAELYGASSYFRTAGHYSHCLWLTCTGSRRPHVLFVLIYVF